MNYKGYIISTDTLSPNLYRVATEGRGGKIPNVLAGCFTKISEITTRIDGYLLTQEQGKKRNDGKANPTD